MLLIEKYGGTSINGIRKMKRIAKHVKKEIDKGNKIIIVVSAFAKETNILYNLSKKYGEGKGKEVDLLLSIGEIKSVALLTMCLRKQNINCISLTSSQIGLVAEGEFQNGYIKSINTNRIIKYINDYPVLIIPGFQGVLNDLSPIILGRGSSDTVALSLAVGLNPYFKLTCTIYTDVDGVYTIDPKKFPNSKRINELSHHDLLMLTEFGAKVMSERSVKIASDNQIPFTITNIIQANKTKIINNIEKKGLTGISFCEINKIIIEDDLIKHINNLIRMDAKIESITKYENKYDIYYKGVIVDNSNALYQIALVGNNLHDEKELLSLLLNQVRENDIVLDNLRYESDKILFIINEKDLNKLIMIILEWEFNYEEI